MRKQGKLPAGAARPAGVRYLPYLLYTDTPHRNAELTAPAGAPGRARGGPGSGGREHEWSGARRRSTAVGARAPRRASTAPQACLLSTVQTLATAKAVPVGVAGDAALARGPAGGPLSRPVAPPARAPPPAPPRALLSARAWRRRGGTATGVWKHTGPRARGSGDGHRAGNRPRTETKRRTSGQLRHAIRHERLQLPHEHLALCLCP